MEKQINVNRHEQKSALLSVVVPAYNEAQSLAAFHERLQRWSVGVRHSY
jgi:hypothetical protein